MRVRMLLNRRLRVCLTAEFEIRFCAATVLRFFVLKSSRILRPAGAHARQHKRRVFIGKRVFEKSWAYRNENRSDRSSRNARASFGEGKR